MFFVLPLKTHLIFRLLRFISEIKLFVIISTPLLINSAFELSQNLITDLEKSNWIGRLFGLEDPHRREGFNYFSCTDILSGMMKEKLLKLDSGLMGRLYPGVW